MREARAAELEAQDQYDAATAALVKVEESVVDPEQDTIEQRRRIDMYVGGVVWTRAVPLLERAKVLQTELVETMVGLRYLLHEFKPDQAGVREPTDETAKAVRDFLRNTPEMPGTYGSVSYGADWDRHPATNPWRQAREVLCKDAEAALPER